MLRGVAEQVESNDEKLIALEAFTERILPGRWAEAIAPDVPRLAKPFREADLARAIGQLG